MFQNSSIKKAYLLAIIACVLWAGNIYIAREANDWIPPFALAFWRWFIVTFVLLPFVYSDFKAKKSVILSSIKYLMFIGVFGVGVFNTLLYIAGTYTTSHNIGLIVSTYPVWTILFASLFRFEPVSALTLIGSLLALFGVFLTISGGNIKSLIMEFEYNIGDLIVLIAAIVWAIYCIMLRCKNKEISGLLFLFVISFIGMLSLLPFYIWETIYMQTPAPYDYKAITAYFYVAIAASIISWLCWNYAVSELGAVKTSLIYYLVPIFASFLGYFILNEDLYWYHFVGFILVFLGIISASYNKIQKL